MQTTTNTAIKTILLRNSLKQNINENNKTRKSPNTNEVE
jgi:hypothetical protein